MSVVRPSSTAGPSRRRSVLALSGLCLLALLACDDSPTSTLQQPEPSLEWTGRYKTTLRNHGWASFRDISAATYDDRIAEYLDAGYILINTGAVETGRGMRYTMVWRENAEGRAWSQDRDMTSSEYAAKWSSLRDQGFRPLDVEGYQSGGSLRFSGIWIDNEEELNWASQRNMTSSEYGDWFVEQRDAGLMPIDIEVYDTPEGVCCGT